MQNLAGNNPSQLAQHLNNLFVQGRGNATYTQGPHGARNSQIDLGVNQGTAITPNFSGRVVSSGWDNTGFGNRVQVYNPQENKSYYLSHLQGIDLPQGEFKAGQRIGTVGSTGNSSGPHIDFDIVGGLGNMVVNAFTSALKKATGQNKVNPKQMLASARAKFGSQVKAISNNPQKLLAYLKSSGKSGSVRKIKL